MSHDATNWAIKQRGIRPALKVVLWNLCDRYHPDNGCFPSQDTLAADCEVSRSSLNTHLDELEERGLIAREQRRTPGSHRQERTRYRFAFEVDFKAKTPPAETEKPSPDSGHGAVSENDAEPSPEIGESRVQNLDSNLVREPVREPVNLREGGREALEEGEDPRKVEAAGWKLLKDWPGFDGMPKKPALACWMKLSAEDRQLATDRFAAWLALLKAQKKSHVPAPSTYFAERLWLDVPAMLEAAKPKNAMAAAYGKLWSATRLATLLAGPTGAISALTATEKMLISSGKMSMDGIVAEKRRKMGWPTVNTMHERARSAQGWLCPLVLEDTAHGFHQVHRDGDLFKAWKREHDRRNWPFLDEGRLPEWIYFPAIDEAQGDIGTAVRDALDRFSQTANTLQQRGKGHDDAA